MKNIVRNALIALFAFSSPAFAAAEAASNGSNFLLTLFVGFFALIIVFQLVPATLMFIGMVKGLVSRESKSLS